MVAEYFAFANSNQLKWAIAGRSASKLEEVQKRLTNTYSPSNKISVLVADAHSLESLDGLVKQTKVIISTVGPFSLYGHLLVDACVRAGTHYVDSTGETLFVKEMIEKYHDQAKEKKVFIVPCCGFDSIPADLGCYL